MAGPRDDRLGRMGRGGERSTRDTRYFPGPVRRRPRRPDEPPGDARLVASDIRRARPADGRDDLSGCDGVVAPFHARVPDRRRSDVRHYCRPDADRGYSRTRETVRRQRGLRYLVQYGDVRWPRRGRAAHRGIRSSSRLLPDRRFTGRLCHRRIVHQRSPAGADRSADDRDDRPERWNSLRMGDSRAAVAIVARLHADLCGHVPPAHAPLREGCPRSGGGRLWHPAGCPGRRRIGRRREPHSCRTGPIACQGAGNRQRRVSGPRDTAGIFNVTRVVLGSHLRLRFSHRVVGQLHADHVPAHRD